MSNDDSPEHVAPPGGEVENQRHDDGETGVVEGRAAGQPQRSLGGAGGNNAHMESTIPRFM